MVRIRDGSAAPSRGRRPQSHSVLSQKYRILVPMPRDAAANAMAHQQHPHGQILYSLHKLPLPLQLLGLAFLCNLCWLTLFAGHHSVDNSSPLIGLERSNRILRSTGYDNFSLVRNGGAATAAGSDDAFASLLSSSNDKNKDNVLVVIISNRLQGILPTVSSVLEHTRSKPIDLVLVGDPVVNEQVRQTFVTANAAHTRAAAHTFTSLTVQTVTRHLQSQGVSPIWTWPEWGSSRDPSWAWENGTIHRAEWDDLETHAHELNHLRFYLPALFRHRQYLYFLDDDVLVNKDLGHVAEAALETLPTSKGFVTPCNIWQWNSQCHQFDFKNTDSIDSVLRMPSLYGDRHVCTSPSEPHCYPPRYTQFIDDVLPNVTGARETKGWNFGFSLFALDNWRELGLTEHYERVMKESYRQHVFPETSLTFGLGVPYLAFAGAVECWDDSVLTIRDGFAFIEWQRYEQSFGVSSAEVDGVSNHTFLDSVDVVHYTGPDKPWGANTTVDPRSLAPWFSYMRKEGMTIPDQLPTKPTQDLFTLLASDRTGAQWIMSTLDTHPNVCASGEGSKPESGFPTDVMTPQGMPWLPQCSIKRGCGFAFARDAVLDMAETMDIRGRYGLEPRRCRNRKSSDPLGSHLPRICNIVEKLHGNFSEGAIESVWVEAFQKEDQRMLGCSCPRGSSVKGLKVYAEWLTYRNFPRENLGPPSMSLNNTALRGSKIIRLKRTNLWARYKSAKLAEKTAMYHLATAGEKRAQISKGGKLSISVDDMLRKIQDMKAVDIAGDEWAKKHGSDVLFVEYEECRGNTKACFQKVFDFLEVDKNHISKRVDEFASSFASFSAEDRSLENIANAGAVLEALATNGYDRFVDGDDKSSQGEYSEIQLLVYDDSLALNKMHKLHEEAGVNTTMFGEIGARDESDGRYAKKYGAALSLLKSMHPESLVVLSNNRDVRLAFPAGSVSSRYGAISKFREAFAKLTINWPGAVIASTDAHCCASALTHGKLGDYFKDDGSRKRRACMSGEEGCKWIGDEKALPWQTFMQELAESQFSARSSDVYLDASLIAGKAADLLAFLKKSDIGEGEDDRAVLTDYMYRNPSMLILDYDSLLFGRNPEGLHTETNDLCPFGPRSDDRAVTARQLSQKSKDSSSIFVHSPRDLGCLLNSKVTEPFIFPVWDNNGIRIEPLLDHLDHVFNESASVVIPYGTATNDYSQGPEIPYFVDEDAIWTSHVIRDKTDSQTMKWRTKPSESLFRIALEMLKHYNLDARWKTLQSTVTSGGFPYWAWYGDFKVCNSNNFRNESIPVFTPSARADCSHAFPVPSYMTIIDSQESIDNWTGLFRDTKIKYPWASKHRQVVWRGSLSEADKRYVLNSTRWRANKMISNDLNGDLYDVGITSVPDWVSSQVDIDISEVGGLRENITPMSDFQKYMAVLDMDGNSWSSRFGSLLCYNSVVVKVEALYVEYFYGDLRPWVHYIPVKNDLSDLDENVAWALDPQNEDAVMSIIASANDFCAQRFRPQALARDVLDTWEAYVRLLSINDPHWQAKWLIKKADLLSPPSKFKMGPVSNESEI